MQRSQIYYIPLFVPDSINVSCKEIIPLLQEIVARLLSIDFFSPFTAKRLQPLKGCYLGLHWDCYPSQRGMPPLSHRGANALCSFTSIHATLGLPAICSAEPPQALSLHSRGQITLVRPLTLLPGFNHTRRAARIQSTLVPGEQETKNQYIDTTWLCSVKCPIRVFEEYEWVYKGIMLCREGLKHLKITEDHAIYIKRSTCV